MKTVRLGRIEEEVPALPPERIELGTSSGSDPPRAPGESG